MTSTQRYDDYGGSSQTYDTVELRFTPKATVEATLDRVFGTGSQYGQSLGLNMNDVELVDGAIYVDPETEHYKLFSWEGVTGFMPLEALDRGDEPSADDADEVLLKEYFGEQKTYELVAARMPEHVDDDGDVIIEATSRARTVELEEGGPEFGEFEDFDGEKVEFRDVISWWDGSEEHGPSTASTSLLETLSTFGSDSVVDENDLHGWLPDSSGDDILRDDLAGRRVEFFLVPRESEQGYTYYDPVVVDVETDERVSANNRSGGDTGSGKGNSQLTQARQDDAGDYPEPIADFIDSGRGLNMTEERADNLLNELVSSTENPLTEEMIDDYGGRDALIAEVV